MTYVLRSFPHWTWCGSKLHNRPLPWGSSRTHDDAILAPEVPHFHRAEPFSILCMDCHTVAVGLGETPEVKVTVLEDGPYEPTLGPGTIVPSERVPHY